MATTHVFPKDAAQMAAQVRAARLRDGNTEDVHFERPDPEGPAVLRTDWLME